MSLSFLSFLSFMHPVHRRLLVGPLAAALLLATFLALPSRAASAQVRGLPEELCPASPPAADYLDREEIAPYHVEAADCLALLGIVRGYGSEEGAEFRPRREVRRDEMAAFIARTLTTAGVDLPQPSGHPFSDVAEGNVHADAIRQLAQVGITHGVGGGRYAPDAAVPRDQMATFLIRATALQANVEPEDLQGGESPFRDVSTGTVHWPNIEGAYELGITNGTAAHRYSPKQPVTRQQMASFLARALDAMTQRITVADRDSGALAHTVFTFASESGRCFQVKAGEAWIAECDPATNEALQLRRITVNDGFSVLVGLAAPPVTRISVEWDGGDPIDLELTELEGSYQAFASPVLASDVTAVVAYDATGEVARVEVGAEGMPFPANTLPDTGDGSGQPVVLTGVRVGDHAGYERVVFDLDGNGSAGWHARYVDEAVQQGSGHVLEIGGAAILEVSLRNTTYPSPGQDVPSGPQPVTGLEVVQEVRVASIFEGVTQVFVGLTERVPFRVSALGDPPRVVLDVVDPAVAP